MKIPRTMRVFGNSEMTQTDNNSLHIQLFGVWYMATVSTKCFNLSVCMDGLTSEYSTISGTQWWPTLYDYKNFLLFSDPLETDWQPSCLPPLSDPWGTLGCLHRARWCVGEQPSCHWLLRRDQGRELDACKKSLYIYHVDSNWIYIYIQAYNSSHIPDNWVGV